MKDTETKEVTREITELLIIKDKLFWHLIKLHPEILQNPAISQKYRFAINKLIYGEYNEGRDAMSTPNEQNPNDKTTKIE